VTPVRCSSRERSRPVVVVTLPRRPPRSAVDALDARDVIRHHHAVVARLWRLSSPDQDPSGPPANADIGRL
jgi:hypothetical protein